MLFTGLAPDLRPYAGGGVVQGRGYARGDRAERNAADLYLPY